MKGKCTSHEKPLAIFHAWVYGPQAALIAERFGTRSRYSGASLGYQLAAPFAGGLAPIIALLLLDGKTTLSALGLSKVVINIGGGSCALLRVEVEPGLLEQENAKRSYQMKEQARMWYAMKQIEEVLCSLKSR